MNRIPLQEQKPRANNHPYIGVGVLLWKGDCLLLGQRLTRHGAHQWQFPGGHLEAGETVLQCAAREVREETGLELAFARHAGFTNETFSAGTREYVTLYVTATCQSGEPKVMEPDKCRSWSWFPYNQLPEPLFLPITNFLKQESDLSVFQPDVDTQSGAQKQSRLMLARCGRSLAEILVQSNWHQIHTLMSRRKTFYI